MNSSKTENDWKNCWNQTTSLEIPTDGKNCYTVAEGTWDKGGGTWSKYTPKQPATYSIMVGDVNDDMFIDIKDATLLQQKLAAAAKYSNTEFVACDANSDESIDVNDATNIMRYVAEVEGNYGKLGFFYGETGHEIEGNILKNGKFELEMLDESNRPLGWYQYKSGVSIVDSDRVQGGKSLMITNDSTDSHYTKNRLHGLCKGQMYKLSGYMKTENIDAVHPDYGAFMDVEKAYVVETSTANYMYGTNDWQKINVYFIAKTSGVADITLRVNNPGTAYFDSLTVTKVKNNEDEEMEKVLIDGEYIDSYFTKEAVSKFNQEDLTKWSEVVDEAYVLFEELVGSVPFNGDINYIKSTDSPIGKGIIAYGGINPIRFQEGYDYTSLKYVITDEILPFGTYHELGHNFDTMFNWSFDHEVTTNYKMIYILDNTDGYLSLSGKKYHSSQIREHYKSYYDKSVAKRDGKYDIYAFMYIYARATDAVGWDTVKATFREFADYYPTLNSDLGRFTYFLYKLQENYNKLNPDANGSEVIDTFPLGELEYVKNLVAENNDNGVYTTEEDYF